jgi:heme/copper-type cytochrome/quinol oxidase subunit 1
MSGIAGSRRRFVQYLQTHRFVHVGVLASPEVVRFVMHPTVGGVVGGLGFVVTLWWMLARLWDRARRQNTAPFLSKPIRSSPKILPSHPWTARS